MGALIAKALGILLKKNSEPARLAAMAVETYSRAESATETGKDGVGYLTLRFDDHNDREVFTWALEALQKFFEEEQMLEQTESR